MKHAFVWFSMLLLSLQAPNAQNSGSVTATYSHGILRATIPYLTSHPGAGQLTVEVLDPEDQALGRIDRRADMEGSSGMWQVEVPLTKALRTDELVWDRLRYRFVYSGQKEPAIKSTDSISQILRMPVMHILGQQSYLTGGAAAVRVIVTDSKNDSHPRPRFTLDRVVASGSEGSVVVHGPAESPRHNRSAISLSRRAYGYVPTALRRGHAYRVHRSCPAGSFRRQELYFAHYRKADLPARPNNSCKGTGAGPVES